MSKIYLVITPFFPEPNMFRGPYVLDQVKAIQRNSDFDVIVMKPFNAYKKEEFDYEIDGINVYRFKDYTLPSNIFPNGYIDNLSSHSLIRKLKQININVKDIQYCHCHVNETSKFTTYLKKINPAIKVIIQHHGFDVLNITLGIFANYQWHKKWCISYGKKLCMKADLHVGVSYKTLEHLKQYATKEIKNEYVLYNGIDKSLFHPQSPTIKNTIYTIGCVGNFWPLKDQMTLIKAIEFLSTKRTINIKVIFIGSGETYNNCIKYIEDHHLESYFEFKKEVMHEQLVQFYQSLDLFVLPSYYEAFGCVYAEAYYCGVNFIAVEGQGISEVIADEDKKKWLIKKGDYQTLAHLIAENIDTPQKQKLNVDLDINVLIKSFIKKLNTI
jgi:glycosyltransferase involved in cell wall biosynthesis